MAHLWSHAGTHLNWGCIRSGDTTGGMRRTEEREGAVEKRKPPVEVVENVSRVPWLQPDVVDLIKNGLMWMIGQGDCGAPLRRG